MGYGASVGSAMCYMHTCSRHVHLPAHVSACAASPRPHPPCTTPASLPTCTSPLSLSPLTPSTTPYRHLWLGNIPLKPNKGAMEVLFSRFGPVESIRVFPGKTFAFVNYHHASHAIAAKAALDGQPSPQVSAGSAADSALFLSPPLHTPHCHHHTAHQLPPAHMSALLPPSKPCHRHTPLPAPPPRARTQLTPHPTTSTQITGLKPLVIRFQRDGVTTRSYNDLRRLVAGKPMSRSGSATNLTTSGSSNNLHRLVEDELPPEPAINLSNRLNPNNIHYDRELAARWVGGQGAGWVGGAGC